MKVAVVNLGCKVNRVESDTIALSYLERGGEVVDVAAADLIVVNTCTVTGEAEKKTRKTIRRALRDNPSAQMVVTGCAAAIDPAFFTGLSERICVVDKADLLEECGDGLAMTAKRMARVGEGFPTRVAVKVQDGCNHSCTYCIVHVARGRAWSRAADAVEAEVCALADAGVKEVVLTGIDLGSYAWRVEAGGRRLRLAGLVRRLLGALDAGGHDDVRLRISSIEPRSLDDEFIELLATSDGRVCRHLHLPLQAGSDRVLAEMGRPYTAEDFAQLASHLYERVPELSLSTDVIVGFPGETDEDFEATCALSRTCRFSKMHVFRYSLREGTPAAARADQVAPEVKDARAHALSSLADELRLAHAQAQVGSVERIVVEQSGQGMTESYYKVRLSGDEAPGSLVRRKLAGVDAGGTFLV